MPSSPSMWSSTDYALDWPAEVLAGELAGLRANVVRPMRPAEVAVLLELAFHTDVPLRHYRDVVGPIAREDLVRAGQWVDVLLEHTDELRAHLPAAPESGASWRLYALGVVRLR